MPRQIPRAIVKVANVNKGERRSDDLAKDGSIVFGSACRKYSLEELVAGITRKNCPSEIDWGKQPRGKEVW